jgi:multisubunit Na+/H+ antiporter MnhC subunit
VTNLAANLPYALSFLLLLIGIYCAISYRDLIKVVCGFSIAGYGVNILLVQIGFVRDAGSPVPPIAATLVDPFPQAMVLTAIVIEFGLMMLMLSMAMRIHEKTGDMDLGLLGRLRG